MEIKTRSNQRCNWQVHAYQYIYIYIYIYEKKKPGEYTRGASNAKLANQVAERQAGNAQCLLPGAGHLQGEEDGHLCQVEGARRGKDERAKYQRCLAKMERQQRDT